jgi:heme-degrading monooxygenase HmoA
MAIKVYITRKVRPDRMKDAVGLLSRVRYGAMKMKGYIMSETLNRIADPTEVMVSSMWHSTEDWERWRTSPERSEFAEEFSKILVGDEKVDLFEIGINQDFIEDE